MKPRFLIHWRYWPEARFIPQNIEAEKMYRDNSIYDGYIGSYWIEVGNYYPSL
jgi:hypothetical protein